MEKNKCEHEWGRDYWNDSVDFIDFKDGRVNEQTINRGYRCYKCGAIKHEKKGPLVYERDKTKSVAD